MSHSVKAQKRRNKRAKAKQRENRIHRDELREGRRKRSKEEQVKVVKGGFRESTIKKVGRFIKNVVTGSKGTNNRADRRRELRDNRRNAK